MSNDQEIVDPQNDGDVVVESKDGDQQRISFQVMQSIYNEITGKTEEIAKMYTRPFHITIADLEQLNAKILQLYEQYSIASANCNVHVYYAEDTRERFSSFERFRAYDQSRLEPMQSLSLEYNFLVVLPKLKKPQSYKVEINLESRVSTYSDRKNQLPMALWRLIGHRTATVSVEYIDYVVARTFLDVTDRWIKGVPAQETPKALKVALKHADKAQHVLKYLFFALSVYLLLSISSHYLLTSSAPYNATARFLVLGFAVVFFSYRIGLWFGRMIENAASSYMELSYLKLNRGDEKLITKAQRNNVKSFFKAVVGGVLAVSYGVIATFVANYLSAT
ncbi:MULTISPECIES: hypothetical protein [Thiorhodovibrio]|uniref:hypothetical protein n=1 Tax=Thiorhodovibrio TaxID=61593 RepID=UPI0019117F4A|nr:MULTISPECIES: hypothetical protein [Thiorhodovibrio]MBK5970727.1 hypothetical protein [Thiorhodovibrio winogradskyi]WPL14589.1 hypothetical protein Thiosp_04438 [Thiorhodovibrio litoralis]